jgi:hypothetical protein
MSSNRRQFERLDLPAEAIAMDEAGQRLGLVSQAGGGGMSIALDESIPSDRFAAGTRLRITVFEPVKQIRHTLDVEVRYVTGNIVGFKFATGHSAVS